MIKVLPKAISELIAAGEVVDRPVSVVKELVENSIDSGATDITVEIKDGGITYIRVSDNGCGIPRAEVPTAFLRHATSKITNADQLNAIETLGFRGEALAAISAVSRTEMITKCATDDIGTSVKVIAGDLDSCEDAGCPTGTTVIVRDLFFPTPARMKFLKKDSTEAAAVASFMDKIALANTGISFKFIKNGKEEMHTPGDGRLDSAINAVFGFKIADTMLPVDGKSWGISVSGFASMPAYPKANRNMQIFFVNGRLVRSRTFTAALDASYANLVPSGRFAACVLNIELNPALVDINVHPAKLEVRFTDEHAVFDAVYHAVKNGIVGKKEEGSISPSKIVHIDEMKKEVFNASVSPKMTVPPANGNIKNSAAPEQTVIPETEIKVTVPRIPSFENASQSLERENAFLSDNKNRDFDELSNKTSDTVSVEKAVEPIREQISEIPDPNAKELTESSVKNEPINITVQQNSTKFDTDYGYHYVGEIYKTYLIFENEEGILFVDKHAAHERIIFNRLKSGFNPDSDAQLLLSPSIISLDKSDADIILSNLDVLASLGFEVDDFGGGKVIVRSVPVKLDEADVSYLIQLIADKLPKGGKKGVEGAFYDDILHSVSCKAAVKAGSMSKEAEAQQILRMLNEDLQARFCPHGRPVCFEIKRKELDKQFLR